MEVPRLGGPPPMGLGIAVVTVDPGHVRVSVVGDVDLATAGELRSALAQVLCAHRPAMLTIDLAEVAFVGAAGITALVDTYNHAHDHDGFIRLVNVPPAVYRVMTIVRLPNLFPVTTAHPVTLLIGQSNA